LFLAGSSLQLTAIVRFFSNRETSILHFFPFIRRDADTRSVATSGLPPTNVLDLSSEGSFCVFFSRHESTAKSITTHNSRDLKRPTSGQRASDLSTGVSGRPLRTKHPSGFRRFPETPSITVKGRRIKPGLRGFHADLVKYNQFSFPSRKFSFFSRICQPQSPTRSPGHASLTDNHFSDSLKSTQKDQVNL
jgi:hypothetical protein